MPARDGAGTRPGPVAETGDEIARLRAQPLRVGVIGCGRIAQVMHLPCLAELPQFDLVAVAEISAEIRHHVTARHPGVAGYADFADLLRRDDLDAIAVLTPDHAAIADEVVRSGRHAFVEKPLCFGAAEGRRLLDLAERAGVQVMVGYMRRHDPAYAVLERRVADLGRIHLVRARDILGIGSDPTAIYTTVLPAGPTGGRASTRPGIADRLREGLGSDDDRLVELYWFVLMLGVHDFSVLRGLLGSPSEVVSTILIGERHLVTTIRYPSRTHVTLELGVFPQRTWSETELAVVGDSETVTLRYDNPWVRYAPTIVHRRRVVDGQTIDELGPYSHRDPFREEWLEFHAAIVERREPATSGREGLADVELAADVVRAIGAEQLDRTLGPTR